MVISGTGCCLVDFLYNQVDFDSDELRPFLSRSRGDGGLTPGKLVFREEFEAYSGLSLEMFLRQVTGGRMCDAMNIGGPSVVSLIHASQLTSSDQGEIRFFGQAGADTHGEFLRSTLRETPLNLENFVQGEGITPSTLVLSDPGYDGEQGERMFIHSMGAARNYGPDHLGENFFDADLVVFGGTALVPRIHDHLTSLLARARSHGCITMVNTVYDFRSERSRPSARWTLGASDESYRYIDLLITDREEAFGLSGANNFRQALAFFREKGLAALIVTNGPHPIHAYSDGTFFKTMGPRTMPVSRKIADALKKQREGDTTGAGDNFAGGVLASLVHQRASGVDSPDLAEACAWGIVSGGFACFYMGGTYLEKSRGEKMNRIIPYFDAYIRQTGGNQAT